MSFIPLHVYSGFSFLKSGLTVNKIPLLAKKNGYEGIGISDFNSLSGYAPFYHHCLENGITPYFLCDFEFLTGLYSFLVLNEEGYKNLLFLYHANTKGELDEELVKGHQKGLAIIINPETTFLHHDYKEQSKSELAKRLAYFLKGFDDVYFGIPYMTKDEEFIGFLRDFLKEYPYKFLAFPFIAYQKEDDAIVTKITEAINDHSKLDIQKLNGDNYFLTKEIIDSYYSKEEIDGIASLTKNVNFHYLQKRGELLIYPNSENKNSDEYLKECAYKGLEKKVPAFSQEYQERLDYELGIISKMGYSDYFLVVADYTNFAKTNDVLVGPGRGSGPASLVSFALDISSIDPIKNGLLFERFLNPERKSMPDIDVDFEDVNRDKVINYLQKKYGDEQVSRVLATQTIGAKEALRDIGRVYGYEDREISLIISTIHNDKLTLRQDYKTSPEFKNLIDSDNYYLEIVSLASKIEGLPRQAGLHAAGLILNNKSLVTSLPLKEEDAIGEVGCLEKDYLEEQGFLKMDLLGLTNLSLIRAILNLIKKNKQVSLSFEDIPYDEKESISLIKQGKTMGIFQMESVGMKRAIKTLEPTSFEDVAALEALFRPGPMDSIPSYARRKKGLEKVVYIDPDLEPILKGTYGIIVYQEQIMQIVQKVASFSLGEADLFRRAISKKDAKKLLSLKQKFLDGCLKNGKSERMANSLFALIEKFANYGFNKAHAYSYAVITCKMAYLKKHYPMEFYCAYLDSLNVGDQKFLSALGELKELKLSLKCPDINESGPLYQISKDKILLPLTSIKGLQTNFIHALVDERTINGPYLDLADFSLRAKKIGLNLTSFIRLTDAGAFDSLEKNRSSIRASAYRFLQYANMISGENGQETLLDLGIEKPSLEERHDDLRENLDAEYEALGLMISASPLDFYKDELEKRQAIPLSEIDDKAYFVSAGIISSVRVITTRKGNRMCFLDVYDDISQRNFVLFDETYTASFPSLKEGNIILIEGHKDNRKEGYVADKISKLGD